MAEQGPGGKGQPDRKRQDLGSDFEPSGSGPRPRPRAATGSELPRMATGSIPVQPAAPAKPAATPASTPGPATAPGVAPGTPLAQPGITPSGFQKKILASSFHSDRQRTQLEAMLGKTRAPSAEDDDDEPTSIGLTFDGRTPAKGLVSRDLWKAINAPVQSREGRRSENVYRLVIDQFAVGHNDRYVEDAPGKPRAHIFVWDVTRAMNAEVPHFVGAKELNLAQTCDWLRHEGPMRGWQRTDPSGALDAANQGYPVLVLPKEIRVKLIAVVRPGEAGSDGKPRLAAAGKARGNDLSTSEALGVFAVEYFAHP